MIPEIQGKLWMHVHGNRRLYSKSNAAQILNSLYPDKKKSISLLIKANGTNIRYTLKRFMREELIIQNPDETYSLTQFGIWFSISNQLGITFLQLCVLASACCLQKRCNENGKQGYYILPFFEEIFKKYYSKKQLGKVFSILRTKGFGYRVTKKSLRVYPALHDTLMHKYGSHFSSLESWLDEIQEQELTILSAVFDNDSLIIDQENNREMSNVS